MAGPELLDILEAWSASRSELRLVCALGASDKLDDDLH